MDGFKASDANLLTFLAIIQHFYTKLLHLLARKDSSKYISKDKKTQELSFQSIHLSRRTLL